MNTTQRSGLPQEWFLKHIQAYFADDEEANMTSPAAQERLARHLWANQPGLYRPSTARGKELGPQ